MRDLVDSTDNLLLRVRQLETNVPGIPGARSGYGLNESWSKVTLVDATMSAGKLERCLRSDVVFLRTTGGTLSFGVNSVICQVGRKSRPSRPVYFVINGVAMTALPSGVILGQTSCVNKQINGSYFVG